MFTSQRNITTHHDMSQTCHMRHICMPGDQIIKEYFWSHNNLINETFQSHPIKMACCSTNEKSLLVTTINPIWHSCPVQPGTKQFNICSLISKENIIFAHKFYSKQNTNQTTNISVQNKISKPKQTKQLVVLIFNRAYFSSKED